MVFLRREKDDEIKLVRIEEIILFLVIVYAVAWLFSTMWLTHDALEEMWRLEQEADPYAASFLTVNAADWCRIIAGDEFKSADEKQRLALAEKQFNKIWPSAQALGFDKNLLFRWYEKTATAYRDYPLKKLYLDENRTTLYRDLSHSDFPKPGLYEAFVFYLFNRNVLNNASILVFVIALPALFLEYVIIIFMRMDEERKRQAKAASPDTKNQSGAAAGEGKEKSDG